MKITSIQDSPVTLVSHNPKITKRTLLAYSEYPPVTNFAQATFPPGEVVEQHAHPDMLEVFLVEAGRGTITIDGQSFDMEPGACFAISPGEVHALRNDSETQDLVVTYFGIQYPSSEG